MNFQLNEIYHIYNRGNNRQKIFFSDRNYLYFIEKMKRQIAPVCDILCWCLMPNHFHLLIHANSESCSPRPSFGGKPMPQLAFAIGKLLSSYTQAINKQNKRTGSLFQQKTKSKLLSFDNRFNLNEHNNYLINVMHYCHQNPLKAGMVKKMEDWPYSSFLEYTDLGNENLNLCNKELLMNLTGYSLKDFYEDSYRVINKFDDRDYLL